MRTVTLAAVAALLALPAWAADETRTITNPLRLGWPWELTYVDDLPPALTAGPLSVTVGDQVRPVQVQKVKTDQGEKARAWFIATLPSGKDAPPAVDVVFKPGAAESTLAVKPDGDKLVVNNGVYTIVVPKVEGTYTPPRPIADLPAPFAGVKLADGAAFVGKWAWAGDARVLSASTRIVEQGPVFVTVALRYEIQPPAGATTASAPADAEEAESSASADDPAGRPGWFYEAHLRFVVGDPWVDVTESYRLPPGCAYTLTLQEPGLFDTVMWVRWFDYEKFGGNVDLHFVTPEPRPKQRGAFVLLRPRWSQQPGGGQDFFVTRVGAAEGYKTPTGPGFLAHDPAKYDPKALAVGVVATYPMKWFDPHAQTIQAFAENGNSARLRFPVGVGRRAYALCVGPRSLFDNTGKMNGLVRRHTDWTLAKQMHGYKLEWAADPAKAGPHILLTRARLEQLRADYKAGKDTPDMQIIKKWEARRDKLKGLDKDLMDLITGTPVKPVAPPTAELWLQRRYQDDFLNPTQGPVRRLKEAFARADLLADGASIRNPSTAALAYIHCDLDYWPGYQNKWGPGNPNFHTDKYMVAIYAGAALADHPDARAWLAFGKANWDDDLRRVLIPPDGVGYECPGYSGYSFGLQLGIAEVLKNTGFGNPVAENPLCAKFGTWQRHLLTPVDVRLGIRHAAPIGDTHRWTSGLGAGFGKLAKFYKTADPAFASEMMGVWQLMRAQGLEESFVQELLDTDQTIPATPLDKMEWGSHAFNGFGAILRTGFGTPRETFVSFKAGQARGHYHNDEMSYHFYGAGRPVSLDYNCSYHPRGDHAALHNSMTFGQARPFTHTGDSTAVDAMEQLSTTAQMLAFKATPAADLVVAERSGDRLVLSPIYPDDAKFQYPYPAREVEPITHRRLLLLVKHPAGSPLHDYLVVRDETRSRDRQQLNVHLLARDVKADGPLLRAPGQWDVDSTLFLAEATEPQVKVGRWYYFDEYMSGPEKWGTPEERQAWAKQIADSDGQALIPPEGHQGKWTVGEYQKWVQVETKPGTPLLWVLYPRKKGDPEPKFEAVDGGVRVTLDRLVDEVRMSSAGGVQVRQNGVETVLLPAGQLPPLGQRGK